MSDDAFGGLGLSDEDEAAPIWTDESSGVFLPSSHI